MDLASLLAFGGMVSAFMRGSSGRNEIAAGNRAKLALWLTIIFLANGLLMFGFKLNSHLPAEANASALPAIMYGTGSLSALLNENLKTNFKCRRVSRKR